MIGCGKSRRTRSWLRNTAFTAVLVTVSGLFGPWAASSAAAQDDEVYFIDPTLSGQAGDIVRLSTVKALDLGDGGTRQLAEAAPLTMGLTRTGGGDVLYGSVTLDPLRVELLEVSPEGETTSYGSVVESSIKGFIDFIGVDLAAYGERVYVLHGRLRDGDLEETVPFRVERFDRATRQRRTLYESAEDLSGLAVDETGNLYVGVLRYLPFRVEILRIAPDGTASSLGTVFDSAGGFTAARPFQLAVGNGTVWFIHPLIEDAGATGTPEQLRRLDLATGQVQVVYTASLPDGDSNLNGLTALDDGSVVFGEAVFEPFRLDLIRRTPDGAVERLGRAVDTTGGTIQLLKVDLAGPPLEARESLCLPSPTRLCLGRDGRFAVTLGWRDRRGRSGDGQAVDIARQDSGLFTFFGDENLEVLVKALDGCAVTGHHWVFASATTNVEFEMTVEDTLTGTTRTYRNPLGTPAQPILDTRAFATCP